MKRLFASIFIIMLVADSCSRIKVVDPKVENQDEPQALHTDAPRFSWKISADIDGVSQESYRILVSSSVKKLKDNVGDLWDSGEVYSGISVLIPYEGRKIGSRSKAWWKVIVKTNKGVDESAISSFGTGILDSSDIYAKWIGHDFEDDILEMKTRLAARYLRKEFDVAAKVKEAKLYISGVGLYEAFINGNEIGSDEYFKPTVSDYDKTVYFNTYDVTDILHKGTNTIGVKLGTGRYTGLRHNSIPRDRDGSRQFRHYGVPRLIAQLEVIYKDGTCDVFTTDSSWKITNKGPIRLNNLFDGERYDARMELTGWNDTGYDDTDWLQAELVESPLGSLLPQPNPPIRRMDIVKPVSLIEKDSCYILDMGQNMVGWLKINIKGQQPGDTLTMRFAEILQSDTTLLLANLRRAEVTDFYIASDNKPIVWEPSFTYHGFRYVEIRGLRKKPSLDDFEGQVLYDQMRTSGSFECSNEIMNKVHKNAYWGIRGNYHGMPTDCPQRDERLGWNGDRTTGAYGEAYIFDNSLMYAKWLKDFEDSQKESGSLPDVVPAYWRFYYDSMTWPGAFITVADMLHRHFGDNQPIVRHYAAMKKWLRYMKDTYGENGIITKDKYGDWCMPPESLDLIHSNDPSRITEAGVLSTAFYHYLTRKMIGFASIAGHPEDIQYFEAEAEESKTAFNREYFNEEMGSYANNTVTANLLGLWFGLVPQGRENDVFRNIVDKTENDCKGHVSTGVVGIQQLMRTLTEYGNPELALKIASNETYPSWGYMVNQGATTIWELWNGNTARPDMNSANHVMLLGDLIIWKYEYLGGISALEPGFKKINLKPYPIQGLDYVNCSYDSAYGTIVSNWKREGNNFSWEFTIPANTTALVYLPTADGYEKKEYPSGTYYLNSNL